jgi:hypothetical protein
MTIKWQDYIEDRKEVMMGKPVFKGARLTVEHVLNELGTGISYEVGRSVLSGDDRGASDRLYRGPAG